MNFLTVFVQPPGNFIYFVLVIGLMMACALMVVGQHFQNRTRLTHRYLIGVGVALGAWALLLVGAVAIITAGGDNGTLTLLAIERPASFIAIVAIGWAIVTADDERWKRRASQIAAGLILLAFAGYLVTTLYPEINVDDAGFVFGMIWAIAPLAVVSGLAIIIVTHWGVITDAPLKLVWAGVFMVGYGLALMRYFLAEPLTQIGAGRLAFAVATAVLCGVVYRAVLSQMTIAYDLRFTAVKQLSTTPVKGASSTSVSSSAAPVAVAPTANTSQNSPRPPQRPVSSGERDSVQLLRALGLMIEDTSPKQLPHQIVKAALEMMRADIGALIRAQDVNYADIACAYDRARNRTLPGVSINLGNQPTLRNAIERGQQRPLFTDRNETELQDLYPRLGIDTMGATYLQPLTRSGTVIGVLLVGYPFANRELGESEIESLRGIGVIAGGLLALSDEAEEARLMAEERAIQAMVKGIPLSQLSDDQVLSGRRNAYIELQSARQEIEQLQAQMQGLEDRLAYERGRLIETLGDSDEDLSLSQRIVAINQEQTTLRDERGKLLQRLQQLESTLLAVSQTDSEKAMESALMSLKRERDELAAQRDRLQTQLDTFSSTPPDRHIAQATVAEMGSESHALIEERDQLRGRLQSLEAELQQFGVDVPPTGIGQVLSELYQERAALKAKVASFDAERDAWSRKVAQLNQRLAAVRESETKLNELQRNVQNLAVDREALTQQLEKMRKQRDELALRAQKFTEYHERAKATIESLKADLEAARTVPMKSANEPSQAVVMELSRAMGRITELEREVRAAKAKPAAPERRAVGQEEIDAMIGLAQELRSPLTSITGYLDLLLKESVGILGDMQRRFVQRVIANAQRLAGMVDDMVRLAALDAGRVRLTFEPVDVVQLVDDTITDVSTPLREKGIEVDLVVDDPVPTVQGDVEAIRQIIGQVLTNAYLATPSESSIQVTVSGRQHRPSDRPTEVLQAALISVRDRGVGVSPESEDQIFDRRYRSENPLIPGLGDTGVAMAVAKALTEAHHGQMWIEMAEGGGTVVNVLLPQTQA